MGRERKGKGGDEREGEGGEGRDPPGKILATGCILAYLFTEMLYDDTINVILYLWVIFSVLMVLTILYGLIWAE